MLTNKNDSPNKDFKEIFEPRFRSILLPEPTSDQESVLYNFVKSQLDYASIVEASTQSLERYFRAVDAGEVEYEIIQADAVIKYSNKVIEQLTELLHILPDLRQTIGSIELKWKKLLDVEPKVFLDAQQKLLTEGFPQEFEQQLRKVGLSDTDIQELRGRATSINLEKTYKDLDSNFEELQASYKEAIEGFKNLSVSFSIEKRKALGRSLPESIPLRVPKCVACKMPLTWIEQYQRWYCYNCKEYR